MSESTLRSTLNLPKTDFPMKANLPQAEPRRLAQWKAEDLYGRIRRARAGRPSFVLHDGPPYANGHIHLGTALNKILKDVIVRSRTMSGKDAPYRPGWDCHGLPIELKVDRDLGAKKREMSPVEFRRACRAYAEKFVGIQRAEFERLGVLGEWDDPYLTMSPVYQATIVRQLADFVEAGLVYKAKKSVHWCISCRTALAEAEVEYDEHHVSPSIDVRFPLAEADRDRLAERFPALAGRRVAGGHLDDDALDAARQPGARLPPRRRVRLLPGRGHERRAAAREGAEGRLRGALARAGQPSGRAAAARRAAGRGQGQRARAPALPPPLDRPRLPRRARRLRHARHRHRHRPHGARATAGTTT